MAGEKILIYINDVDINQRLTQEILGPAGYEVIQARSQSGVQQFCRVKSPDTVLIGEEVFDEDEGQPLDGVKLASSLVERYPSLSVMVIASPGSAREALDILRAGLVDYLKPPLERGEVLQSVQRAVLRHQKLADWARLEVKRNTSSLQQRVDTAETERKKLNTLLAEIGDGLIAIDPMGRLLLVNQAARLAFGIDGEQWFGKPLFEVIQHPDLMEILNDQRSDNPFRAEISLEDGRVLNAQVASIPEIGVVVSMQDITHLKELDRIKNDFVNTVSHDLRSPLTAILGYVELIERSGEMNEQQLEFIQRIHLGVQSITVLINDLLDLGKIEAGIDIGKEELSLANMIHLTLDSFKPRILEKSLSLELQVPEDLPHIYGNPVRIRQLLTNLIGNAVKFTPEEGEISVRAQAEARQVLLKVKDSGVGIPAADQPYIFERFYRASNVSNRIPGTGLGLAIVKSIVEDHHGRIWVESNPGCGTTFTVILPAFKKEV